MKYLQQFVTTNINVGGGIDDSQTTGIVLQSLNNIDATKPSVACLSWSDPLSTSVAEWITYESINSTTNELQGVTRGAEGYSAKTHLNQAVVAFPLSKSHINELNDAVTAITSGTQTFTGAKTFDTALTSKQIDTPSNPASGYNKIYFKSDNKAYTLTSAGVETAVGSSVADTEVFIIPGTLPSSATTNISKTWFAPANLTLSKIDLYVGTAGASTGSTVIDVNKNGTTVCASTKPTLTTTETSDLDITPSTTAVSKGDAITIDVDSTTATAPVDAYVLIHYTRD